MKRIPALVLAVLSTMPALAGGAELDGYRRLAASGEARMLLEAARSALESGVETSAPSAADTIAWPEAPAGIYVSLLTGRATRACVGSPSPPRGTLASSVRAMAALALHADPRRPPVRHDELAAARIVISFTNAGERIASPYAVDPGRQGLLVTSSRGSIAFLPGEARTIQWALREARRAGVVAAGETPVYRRLEVVAIREPLRRQPWRDEHELP